MCILLSERMTRRKENRETKNHYNFSIRKEWNGIKTSSFLTQRIAARIYPMFVFRTECLLNGFKDLTFCMWWISLVIFVFPPFDKSVRLRVFFRFNCRDLGYSIYISTMSVYWKHTFYCGPCALIKSSNQFLRIWFTQIAGIQFSFYLKGTLIFVGDYISVE